MKPENNLSQIAAMLGRAGGSSKSAAKQQAARLNGSKGGRPRKQPEKPSASLPENGGLPIPSEGSDKRK